MYFLLPIIVIIMNKFLRIKTTPFYLVIKVT